MENLSVSRRKEILKIRSGINAKRNKRCRKPPREIPPMTQVMRRRPDRQRQVRIRETPQTCSSIYLKNQNLSYYFVPFTNSSDINRGLSLTTFLWRKSNLGLQLISLLDMKGIFQFKPPCQHSSLSDRFIQTLAAMHRIIHSFPTVRGMGSLKHRVFQRVKSYQSSAGVRFHYWANAAKFPYLLSTMHLGVYQLTQLECKKNKCSFEINHIRLLN